ncbi:leucine--tRNA ligase [Candidatus Kaiserbacteria bacterium]|nr:leucine--tRNA ligase [Candidatus Kaiserbacteria bacterium]
MASTYDPKEIEAKWQKKWEESRAFAAEDTSDKPKQYILDMFPYPSGDGLHVGHVEGYTATDIYSRYQRMRGFNVLHPMGWDAFGLPAENYAIKTGVPPQETTDKSINNFRKQIKALGLSYDWDREVGTHNPDYYRWTQWLFAQFFEKGLVYKKKALVNWDPVDQTVLANEQVLPDGTAERSGAKVEKRDLEQWFFKITDYADELADSLDKVDWPESTKINQRNWIGRSEGAQIKFPISNSQFSIEVFTTRPDTLFGATYVVLAPEHPLVTSLPYENKAEVEAYVQEAKNKSDIDRSAEGKDKTGVELKGVKAINPANKEEVPVWVADYVLGHYGTGAIMAVPAHDERDKEFAQKFGLAVREIELEDPKEMTAKVGGTWTKQYRLRDWLVSRQRYWGAPIPIVYDPEGKAHAIPEEHLPWMLPTDVEFKPTGTSPLGQSKELLERTERIFGKGWKPEIDTMDTFVCSSWYFFRFTDPRNEKEFASKAAMQQWLPVDLYVGGAEHTVLHLLYARFFTKALRDLGYLGFDEPFLKLRHQGTILAEDSRKMSKRWGNVINPDDMVERFGADAVRLYEMFMGPLEAMKPWNTNNIAGVRRFLERVWRLETGLVHDIPNIELETLVHQTIKKVGDDIESLKMNTAVSALMILLNAFEKYGTVPLYLYGTFLQLLAPFAPHLTSELVEKSGITLADWPQFDPSKLTSSSIKIAVQVNGKLRATVTLAPDASEDEALLAAREAVKKWLTGAEKKAVYIPGKIVSLVV